MGESMKYLVTLKRKPTTNAAQNARMKRVEVLANNEQSAKEYALTLEHNWRYFIAESVRRA